MMRHISLAAACVLGLIAVNGMGDSAVTSAILAAGLFISSSVYSLRPSKSTRGFNKKSVEFEKTPLEDTAVGAAVDKTFSRLVGYPSATSARDL